MQNTNDPGIHAYLEKLTPERLEAIQKLRQLFQENLPNGFVEEMSYGMIGYVVPHALYPAGYHCNPKLPLPFISIASQKQFVAIYHMGLYMDQQLYDWFIAAHAKVSKQKLDIGKSCIRYKKPEHIPFELIAELASKMSPEQWILNYTSQLKK